MTLPSLQTAVQLTGPDRLVLNRQKPVFTPGPRQILGQVQCVGLCFSDMKLLHQFDQHVRKAPVSGWPGQEVLAQIPSYVPGSTPTVPGHEVVITVVAVGSGVTTVQVGRSYLVQADWRDVRTASSNGAFGYNFEGGLQEYVLLDERLTVARDGKTSYLLEMPAGRGISATALVEPWACVEDAFIHAERCTLKTGGTLLLACSEDAHPDLTGLDPSASARRLWLVDPDESCPEGFTPITLPELAKGGIDDLLFAGTDAELLGRCWPLLASNGLCLLAQCDQRFARPVAVPVGRVHYGNIRLAGYPGSRFDKALHRIPDSGEVRPGDRVHVIGAAGPMGSMAVIRILALGLPDTAVEASDLATDRLAVLGRKARPLAKAKEVDLHLYSPKDEKPYGLPDYAMVMVPVPALVAAAVRDAEPGGIVNIFAGIPADVSAELDLDAYCDKGLYLIGTSGSTMDDIHAVLAKVGTGDLDTNLSVGAVCGMDGAIDGLQAVKDGRIAGKILVYPALVDLPLTDLDTLAQQRPEIGKLLRDGNWTQAAEAQMLSSRQALAPAG